MEDISPFTSTRATASTRSFAIITVADRHLAWAEELADLLRDESGVSVHVDTSDEPASERIGAALCAGEIALIVDDVDVENGTAAVRILSYLTRSSPAGTSSRSGGLSMW